jgi:hypothetical protein
MAIGVSHQEAVHVTNSPFDVAQKMVILNESCLIRNRSVDHQA